MKKYIIFFIVVLNLGIFYNLSGYKNGIIGLTSQTTQGCSLICHGSHVSLVNLNPTSTSDFTVYAGEEIEFTIRLTNAYKQYAGINIAVKTSQNGIVNAGTLTAVSPYLKLMENELTHTEAVQLSQGGVDFVFRWRAPETSGSYYLQAVGSANTNDDNENDLDDWNWMNLRQIIVNEPPRTLTLNTPNGNEVWCTNTNYNITWTSEYVDYLKIELSTDGGNTFPILIADNIPAEAGSWQWSIPDNVTGTNNKIRISDNAHSYVNDVSNIKFLILTKTAILTQPATVISCLGENVSFSVNAVGAGISYQWRKDGNDIPNAVENNYSIVNLSENDVGDYSVYVNGNCGGSVLSQTAQLRIKEKPRIHKEPLSDTVCIGTDFNIFLSGSYEIIEWYKNGIRLENISTSSFDISNAKYEDSGEFYAILRNGCGEQLISDTAFISVTEKPIIIEDPEDMQIEEGDTLMMLIKTSTGFVDFQWRKDGKQMVGMNDSVLVLKSVKLSDSGIYDCIAFNKCGSDTSTGVEITIQEAKNKSELSFKKDNLELGNILINSDSTIIFKDFIINSGKDTLLINKINVTGMDSSTFIVNEPKVPFKLISPECRDMIISYSNIRTGEIEANLEFEYNQNELKYIPIIAFGTDYKLNLPTEINFGELSRDLKYPYDTVIKIRNSGNTEISIDTFMISGHDSLFFNPKITELPVRIAVDDSTDVIITFDPKDIHERNFDGELNMIIEEFGKFERIKLKCNLIKSEVNDYHKELINVFPNPATGTINIEVCFNSLMPGRIVFYDLLGRIIYVQDNLIPENGYYKLSVDLNEYSEFSRMGLYYVNFSIKGLSAANSVIINWKSEK